MSSIRKGLMYVNLIIFNISVKDVKFNYLFKVVLIESVKTLYLRLHLELINHLIL